MSERKQWVWDPATYFESSLLSKLFLFLIFSPQPDIREALTAAGRHVGSGLPCAVHWGDAESDASVAYWVSFHCCHVLKLMMMPETLTGKTLKEGHKWMDTIRKPWHWSPRVFSCPDSPPVFSHSPECARSSTEGLILAQMYWNAKVEQADDKANYKFQGGFHHPWGSGGWVSDAMWL